jgi:alkaline phosphatase
LIRVLFVCALAAAGGTLAQAAQPAAPAPRNIILMIADGCGFNHLRAAALWQEGAEMFTAWDDLPVRLAVSTFAEGGGYDPVAFWAQGPESQPPTDSAAAITALTTGHKTRNGRLAMTSGGAPLTTVVEAMERGGRSTGVVTSVQFAHATPAGCAVQALKRSAYLDISRDMLTRSALDVVMGAGHPLHDHQGRPATDADYRNVGGEEIWQGLLAGTAGGDADGDGWPDPWVLVQDADAFAALTAGEAPARVVGVARVRETLQQQRPGDPLAEPFAEPPLPGVPTLPDMAIGAINVLDADPDGFFLMIEGGAVDWAAHNNQPGRLIEEVVEFARTVAAVRAWIDAHGGWSENLLIITADHETGYLTGPAPADGPDPACRLRQPLVARGQGRMPEMRFNSRDHTNSLVPLFAAGNGGETLVSRATGNDPGRGAYLDNIDIGALLRELAARKPVPIVTK